MTLNEIIARLIELKENGNGDLLVVDYMFAPIDEVRKSINTDYNTGNETDVIMIS